MRTPGGLGVRQNTVIKNPSLDRLPKTRACSSCPQYCQVSVQATALLWSLIAPFLDTVHHHYLILTSETPLPVLQVTCKRLPCLSLLCYHPGPSHCHPVGCYLFSIADQPFDIVKQITLFFSKVSLHSWSKIQRLTWCYGTRSVSLGSLPALQPHLSCCSRMGELFAASGRPCALLVPLYGSISPLC